MSVQFCMLFFRKIIIKNAVLQLRPAAPAVTFLSDVPYWCENSAWWILLSSVFAEGVMEDLYRERRHRPSPHRWLKTQIHQWRFWVDTCIGETAAAGGARTGMPLRGLRAVEWMWPEWPGPSERTARLREPWKQHLRSLDGGNKKAEAPTRLSKVVKISHISSQIYKTGWKKTKNIKPCDLNNRQKSQYPINVWINTDNKYRAQQSVCSSQWGGLRTAETRQIFLQGAAVPCSHAAVWADGVWGCVWGAHNSLCPTVSKDSMRDLTVAAGSGPASLLASVGEAGTMLHQLDTRASPPWDLTNTASKVVVYRRRQHSQLPHVSICFCRLPERLRQWWKPGRHKSLKETQVHSWGSFIYSIVQWTNTHTCSCVQVVTSSSFSE